MKYTTEQKRIRRHARIRSRVSGTLERPRLAVSRSNQYITAQVINDATRTTIVGMSDKSLKLKGTKSERASLLGKEIAKQAQAFGVTSVVFDRGGFRFTGRIKAVADGARQGGLKF